MNTEFDPVTHTYKVDGVIWPSVTQLLSEFKLVDYSGVPAETLERKRLIGIRVHAATVMLDNGVLDEEDFNWRFPECIGFLEAYRKFRVIETFEPVYKESRYFSKKWKYAGTPDESGVHVTNMGSEQALIDYKCTWAMYASISPQLEGYKILLEENRKEIKIKKLFGLLLKPTGNYELVQFKDRFSRQDFLACVILHWRKRNFYKTSNGITDA